jgi:3-oxoacyl-[acyl-carrier protein] reductase
MFEGQLVFVTGGATGIGAAIVERFVTLGADVACCYNKSRAGAEAIAAKLRTDAHAARGATADENAAPPAPRVRGESASPQDWGAGGSICGADEREIFLLKADVSDVREVQAAIEATVAHFGKPINILVNNAGDNIDPQPVESMPEELWEQVIGINLTGPFLLAKYCIPGMKALGGGRIINVTSISARTGGGPGSAHYVASKAGLEGFTRSLAKELAPFNITVNGVAPGLVYTPIHERINTPESLERLRQNIPLLRIGKADEVARVVTFLASEDASFMTGEIVAVNGGMRMD